MSELLYLRNSGKGYSLLSMERITLVVIPWLTVCSLSISYPGSLAFAGNVYLGVLAANNWQGRQRNIILTGTTLLEAQEKRSVSTL